MISSTLSRRSFVHAVTAATLLDRIRQLAAAERKRFKIRDVRTMTLQGPSRTYVLVKVIADDELYGIAEAYGTPGVGVKEQILSLKPGLLGKDPLEIDTLYTFLDEHAKDLSGTRTDGSAHNLMRAASGIEMALWDLAWRLVQDKSLDICLNRTAAWSSYGYFAAQSVLFPVRLSWRSAKAKKKCPRTA